MYHRINAENDECRDGSGGSYGPLWTVSCDDDDRLLESTYQSDQVWMYPYMPCQQDRLKPAVLLYQLCVQRRKQMLFLHQ